MLEAQPYSARRLYLRQTNGSRDDCRFRPRVHSQIDVVNGGNLVNNKAFFIERYDIEPNNDKQPL